MASARHRRCAEVGGELITGTGDSRCPHKTVSRYATPYWAALWAANARNQAMDIAAAFALCAYALALTSLITWQLHQICEAML